MTQPQLHPLQVHPVTGEPFLRLPTPHENVIITPPRMSDLPAIVANLNDFRVYQWLEGPPFPYTEDDGDFWLRKVKDSSDAVLQQLKEGREDTSQGPFIVGSCPVRSLREVQEDGTELYLGEISVDRCGYPDMKKCPEKAKLVEENSERDAGDPEIVWCIGDYLAASHHGRGIMSAAIGTIIRDWMVPRMASRKIRAEAFVGNIGSRRVFEKNGFVLEETVEFVRETNAGMIQRGMDVLWWRS